MTHITTAFDLSGIAPDAVHDEFRQRAADSWPDDTLVAAAGAVIARPKVAPADSFVLHAPLELLARAGLLAFVAPEARAQARERIASLAATYEAAGEAVEPAPGAASSGSRTLDEIAIDLVVAVGAGDLEAVDQLAVELGTQATPLDLRHLLAEPVATALAAAGHSSILFSLFPHIETAHAVPAGIVRGPVREIARHPDWRIRWFDAADLAVTGPSLHDALLHVPMLGSPGSDFIFPVMNQVEAAGVAAELLSGVVARPIDVPAARRELARVAAWSMLQEPPDHAPYGWTHCLTMPQATMALAGDGLPPRTALAVAATYVAGFCAALGSAVLDPSHQPERPHTSDLAEAIAAGPNDAAATAWHAPDSELDAIATALATRASLHHDAHLVKYTLACFHAMADDPDERRLYLAAAASLSGWWAQQPPDGFFD